MPTQPESKPWFASKGVWGSLTAAAGSLFLFLESVSPGSVPEDVAEQVADPNLPMALTSAAVFIAALVSWVGRVVASKPIASGVAGKGAGLLLLALTAGACLPMVAVAPGCGVVRAIAGSDDPIAAYDQANEVYIAVVEVAVRARTDGLIGADEWRETYLPLINRGDALLDSLEVAASLGDATEVDRLVALLEAVNAEIRMHITPPTP